jgi:hypothetical protein
LASKPEDLQHRVTAMLTHDAAAWRGMKNALAAHGKNSGAIAAAELILES